MADQFGLFWNSINSDRTYDADSFAEWLRKFFTTGIFNGEMQVTPGAGMQVNVAPGYANLNGKVRFFDTAQTFTLDPASGTYPRIDTIVVRSDSTNRIITTEYVKGAYSGASPVPTAPVRTGGIYEIVLAQILVGAGITAIMAQDITDTRPNDELCGWVTSTVESVPMDQITTQMQADFLAWYDRMKGQLSEDAAGSLQNQIDNVVSATSQIVLPSDVATENIRKGKTFMIQTGSYIQVRVATEDIAEGENVIDSGKSVRTFLTTVIDQNKEQGAMGEKAYRGLAKVVLQSPPGVAIRKGEIFMYDDPSYPNIGLWVATQDISATTPLVVNENIQAETVESQLALLNTGIASLIQKTTASGTTSSSGALATPVNTATYAILSTRCTNNNNYFAMGRGDNYFTCFKVVNNALVVAANEALTFEVMYVKKS